MNRVAVRISVLAASIAAALTMGLAGVASAQSASHVVTAAASNAAASAAPGDWPWG